MKEEDYCSKDTSELLIEKGYGFPRLHLGAEHYDVVHLWIAQKWLREKYNIVVCPNPYFYKWDYTIYDLNKIEREGFHKILGSRVAWETYEQALDAGIMEALKMI